MSLSLQFESGTERSMSCQKKAFTVSVQT